MTILHKCSKTHGHYLVLLVTSWLRLKAEKCDWVCWEGLWCLPGAQAAHKQAEVWAAQLWRQSLLLTRRWGWALSSEHPRSPVHGALLHMPPQVGEGRLALGHAPVCAASVGDGWLSGTSPRPRPFPKALLSSLLCLSQRPLVLDGFGGSDIVQGWARNGQQQEGLCLGAR